MESKEPYAVKLNHFDNLISPHEAAEILEMASGTVKNKCAAGELLCKKVGKQWVLDKTYLKELETIEMWKPWHLETGYFLYSKEIDDYVIPNIDPERYFEVHKEMLADKYNIEEDELTMDDIDWEDEQMALGDLDECAFKLEDFDEDLAQRQGYRMPDSSDSIYRAYTYLDSGTNWKTIWQEDMDSVQTYRITSDNVSLDEWNGHNFQTGGTGQHESVHRIVDTADEPVFLIVYHSQWQGEQSKVIEADLSLEGVLDYIANIDDGQERDLDDYREKLLEL